MAHAIVAGMTGSGKTTLVKLVFRQLRLLHKPTCVLDPKHDARWVCDYKFHSFDGMFAFLNRRQQWYVAIDEAGKFGKYSGQTSYLMCEGRHLSHNVFLIIQDLTQLAPTTRDQASTVYLFATSGRAMRIVADEFNKPDLLSLPPLAPLEYYHVPRFGEISKFRLDPRSGTVYRCNHIANASELRLDSPPSPNKGSEHGQSKIPSHRRRR